jgi:hypothetical protein
MFDSIEKGDGYTSLSPSSKKSKQKMVVISGVIIYSDIRCLATVVSRKGEELISQRRY